MRGRDVLIAFIVLVAIIAGVLIFDRKINISKTSLPTATPTIQQQIESKFNGLTIPAGTEQTELKDVSGGQGMGIATRNEILADLPTPPAGQYYQGWLGNGGKLVLLGILRNAKGGWILDYNSSNLPGYNQIVVTLAGKHILEGSF
ncbi:MAG: anti-sigma factor [Candidatus Microgenomates bacterium]|jgi:hypothetical protein